MAAGILLYGVALDDSDTAWAEFFEAHGYDLSAAAGAVAQRQGVEVGHPPFGCAVVGRPWWWFVTVPESCLLATGRDVTPVDGLKVERGWDARLRQFCDLFDLGAREPAWYVTWVDDGEHRGHQFVVS